MFLSIITHVLLAIIILSLAYLAIQPILFPSDWLAPRYFVSFYLRPYGWILTALFITLSVILQILSTKWSLRYVNASPTAWHYLFIILPVICVIVGGSWTAILGDFAVAHFLVFAVGFLAPGVWPAYLVLHRWETQHQQTLIFHGLTFKTLNE